MGDPQVSCIVFADCQTVLRRVLSVAVARRSSMVMYKIPPRQMALLSHAAIDNLVAAAKAWRVGKTAKAEDNQEGISDSVIMALHRGCHYYRLYAPDPFLSETLVYVLPMTGLYGWPTHHDTEDLACMATGRTD